MFIIVLLLLIYITTFYKKDVIETVVTDSCPDNYYCFDGINVNIDMISSEGVIDQTEKTRILNTYTDMGIEINNNIITYGTTVVSFPNGGLLINNSSNTNGNTVDSTVSTNVRDSGSRSVHTFTNSASTERISPRGTGQCDNDCMMEQSLLRIAAIRDLRENNRIGDNNRVDSTVSSTVDSTVESTASSNIESTNDDSKGIDEDKYSLMVMVISILSIILFSIVALYLLKRVEEHYSKKLEGAYNEGIIK